MENLSYGANTMRDGVSLASQTRTKPLVLPSEIRTLKDCEAYIKLPWAFPVTKIQMRYKKIESLSSEKNEVFIFSPLLRPWGFLNQERFSETRGNPGAGCRIRTNDPLITNQVLYQLS
jgi:hypothetical protein